MINGLRGCELVIVNYGFITPLCTGSSVSISVWGPVVDRTHTVAPCRVMHPVEFSLFYCHDSHACVSVCFQHIASGSNRDVLLFASLPVAPKTALWLVCYYPFPTLSKEDKACD